MMNQKALREAMLSLESDVQTVAEQLTAIQQEHTQPRPGPVPEKPDTELLRLRAEIHQLRDSLAELQRANTAISNQLAFIGPIDVPFVYPDAIARKEYTFRGYESPQASLQSFLWALTRRDGRQFKAGIAGRLA